MRAFPQLSVGQWRLRAIEHGDAERWLEIVLDPELRRLTSWEAETIDAMRRVVAGYVDGPRAHTTRRWAIVDTHGAFSGTCGFKDWDRESGTAELVYELARELRGRGAMTAIAEAVMAHGFSDMRLRSVSALVMVENAASIRLLEKLGFERTGTLPALRRCGGMWRDLYRYERCLVDAGAGSERGNI